MVAREEDLAVLAHEARDRGLSLGRMLGEVESTVATLNRRHFSVVRPSHCDHLTLLPE